MFCKKQNLSIAFFTFLNQQPLGATDNNHVEKTLPQPQQQPNKPQKTTQHQKQTHNKPPKNSRNQKNPQQQPNKKKQISVSPKQVAPFSENSTDFSSIRQKLAHQEFSHHHRKTLKAPISRINVIPLEAAHKPHE